MQTITTRFLGPTNTRGARIVARTSSSPYRVTLSYDDRLDSEQRHMLAAWTLAKKLDWLRDGKPWVGGESPDRRGYTFVCAVEWAPRLTAEPPDFVERRAAH